MQQIELNESPIQCRDAAEMNEVGGPNSWKVRIAIHTVFGRRPGTEPDLATAYFAYWFFL